VLTRKERSISSLEEGRISDQEQGRSISSVVDPDSLKPDPNSKDNIQQIKKIKFTYRYFFYFFGSVRPSGSGSRDPIESGSNPDPDPQLLRSGGNK
jgi:hypothetical protein